ncbi:MAG: hypothetical protein HY898_10465 [Deltaproteobacteria bacterium]|nr:hypothetical protein [Deltaproteobacteria bacterium]
MTAVLLQDSANDAQSLFERVFWPLYPEDVRDNLAAARESFVNPANDCGLTELIEEIAEAFKLLAPSILGLPQSALDDTDASVHRLGAALTRDRRDRLLLEQTVGRNRTPLLAMIAIHGTAYIGRCIVKNHCGEWLVRRPLWESTVRLHSALGQAELSIFQWWLKSLSDEEVDRVPLGDRYRTYVEVPCFQSESLPVLVPSASRIPRLKRPQYHDVLRHLQAHAPGVVRLGADFPDPERFAQMQLAWLDFLWVGGGRMLLMHGPSSRQGVRLLWLNAEGFVKSAFYPADDVPAHKIKVHGDFVRVILSMQKQVKVHEMPWWGL